MEQGRVQRLRVPRAVRRRRAGAARTGQGMDAAQGATRLPRHLGATPIRRAGAPGRLRPGVRRARVRLRPTGQPRDPQRHDPADRTDDHRIRRRRAAGAVRRPLPGGGGAVLPAVLGTGRRERSGRPRLPGHARRRRVGDQRAEGLELGSTIRRVGRAHRSLRSRCREAQGPHGLHHPDGPAGHRDSSDPPDERRCFVQRGVLQRRANPRLDAAGRCRRRLAGRADDARFRARPIR